MEDKICVICGKEFSPTYSKQMCCCKSCATTLRNRNRNIPKILKRCYTCGKEFYVTPSGVNRKYCCRDCTDKGRTTQVKKVCEYCGKEYFVVKQRENKTKYCCRECADKAKMAKPNCVCPTCGKEFHTKPYQLQKYGNSFGNYCSRECLKEARKTLFCGEKNHQYGLKGPLNDSFKGQEITGKNHNLTEILVYMPNHLYANKNGRVKKHRLLVEQNYEKFNPEYFDIVDGIHYLKPAIDVHHIDGNHNNNTIENLIPCTRSEHLHIHAIMRKKLKEIAVSKQDELLGSPEVGNQQPSTPLTKCEGSETNS